MWSTILSVALQAVEWYFAWSKNKQVGYEEFLEFVRAVDKNRHARLKASYDAQIARLKAELDKNSGEG